ncbi:MAG: DMT family transporter [Lacrimispora sp.]
MYNFLSLLAGIVIAFMVAVNGGLTAHYGVFGAAVIIHIVGSCFAFLLIKICRQKTVFQRSISWWMYTGGVIGVLTTVFNNFAYGKISLTSIIAVGLLGQTVTSLVIDSFGLFGMQKYRFKKSTLIGLVYAVAGIIVMLDHSAVSALYAVVLSFAGGVTVVLSRTVNAGLSENTGALQGSFINHIVGLPVTVCVLFLWGGSDPIFTGFAVSASGWIYFGGVLGVLTVLLLNITVPKIPGFRLTLLSFIGQMFAGISLDLITKQGYTKATFFGGLLVAAGVVTNVLIEQAYLYKERKAQVTITELGE